MPDTDNKPTAAEDQEEFLSRFVDIEESNRRSAAIALEPFTPARLDELREINDISEEQRLKFRDKSTPDNGYSAGEGEKRPLNKVDVPKGDLDDAKLVGLLEERGKASTGLAADLAGMAAEFARASFSCSPAASPKEHSNSWADPLAQLIAARPEFVDALTIAFSRTAYALVSREPQPLPAAPPEMPLPTEAPRLWADRPDGMKAAQFVRETYAPWIEAGVLTRAALKACDKALYHAYHVWVHRHPEDVVPLKETPQPHFIADAGDAIERRRAAGRNSKAKARARERDGLSQELAMK